MIVALLLTLSMSGQFEIRSEGRFRDMESCILHMVRWRAQNMDFARGNMVMRCMPEKELDSMLRAHFGGRA